MFGLARSRILRAIVSIRNRLAFFEDKEATDEPTQLPWGVRS